MNPNFLGKPPRCYFFPVVNYTEALLVMADEVDFASCQRQAS